MKTRPFIALLVCAWPAAMSARACGFIAWSWWYLLTPVWLFWAACFALLFYVVAAVALGQILDVCAWWSDRRERRRRRREHERVRQVWRDFQNRNLGFFHRRP